MTVLNATASRNAALPKLPAFGFAVPALAVLIVGAAFTGFAPIFARFSEAGPLATGGTRMLIAFAVMLVLTGGWPTGKAVTRATPRRSDRWLLGVAGLCFAGDLGCFHLALETTSVANATLLVNLAPVFVGAGAWAFFGERPTGKFIGGALLAVAGAALLSVGAAPAAGGGSLTGDLIAVAGAAFYGGYLVVIKRLRAVYPSSTVMLWSTLAAAATLLPLALISGEDLLQVTAAGWIAVLCLGLVGHIMGQGLVAHAMAWLPVGYSSLVLLVQPLVAAIGAWAIFGEALAVVQAAGAALILAGIFTARPSLRNSTTQASSPENRNTSSQTARRSA